MKALVLIRFTSLETRQAYARLKGLEPVVASSMMYGRFDAVLILQAANLEDIRHVILSDIQTIPGVVETLPCIIIEDENLPAAGAALASQMMRGASSGI